MGKVLMSWSGGKDCMLALHHLTEKTGKKPDGLLTAYSDKFKRVTMHGVPMGLIEAQANAIEIPLFTLALPENVTDGLYEELLLEKYQELIAKGFDEVVFGDILLEDLRDYRIRQLDEVGLKYQFPLWQRNTKELIKEFLSLGFKAMIVSMNGILLPKELAGVTIDDSFIQELPVGVDPCGENGEFHTFVYEAPLFQNPIAFEKGQTIDRTYTSPADGSSVSYWFTDLIVK